MVTFREQELIPNKSKHLEYCQDERFDENEARLYHILEYGHTWDRLQFVQTIEASVEAKNFARWAVLATGAGNPILTAHSASATTTSTQGQTAPGRVLVLFRIYLFTG